MSLYFIIFIFILFFILITIKIISLRKSYNANKDKYGNNINLAKRIEELQKIINENPNDYSSLLELAMIEDKIGNSDEALVHYEKLIEDGYFDSQSNDAFNIFRRIEEKYTKEDNRIEMLKYCVKLLKMEPSHIEYAIKIATILGVEGQYLLSSQYFDKILHSRTDLTIEQLKVAIFSFYKVKDFKKVSIFLEELYKKLFNSNDEDIISDDNIIEVSIALISAYLASHNYSQAKYLIDKLLVNKNIDSDGKVYLDRLLLFTLYKLNNNYNFINFYHTFLHIYDMKNYVSLAFDYGFYSYFLNKISHSLDFFNLVIHSKDENFAEYDIPTIIKYLSEIKLAFNENYYSYDKQIDQEYISHWENVVELWETSLMNFNYLENIVEINKTIDTIDKELFEELSSNIYNNNTNKASDIDYSKLDSIYNMSVYEFKELTNIIIDKLGYVAIGDYFGTKKESFKDEFNYITYNKDGNKRDTTLISFKRWSNDKIGELVLRDFGILIKECNAKNGILFIPTELTSSAKSYARHRDNIIVYTREQYNNLLKYL